MRDTYKYRLKTSRRIVHRGVTTNLSRREQEHQTKYPGSKTKQIGKRTTCEAALEWERNGGKR
jgi:predicted GIY-YIG superfamily endonuclease